MAVSRRCLSFIEIPQPAVSGKRWHIDSFATGGVYVFETCAIPARQVVCRGAAGKTEPSDQRAPPPAGRHDETVRGPVVPCSRSTATRVSNHVSPSTMRPRPIQSGSSDEARRSAISVSPFSTLQVKALRRLSISVSTYSIQANRLANNPIAAGLTFRCGILPRFDPLAMIGRP
jgi:hypothetical protein